MPQLAEVGDQVGVIFFEPFVGCIEFSLMVAFRSAGEFCGAKDDISFRFFQLHFDALGK